MASRQIFTFLLRILNTVAFNLQFHIRLLYANELSLHNRRKGSDALTVHDINLRGTALQNDQFYVVQPRHAEQFENGR